MCDLFLDVKKDQISKTLSDKGCFVSNHFRMKKKGTELEGAADLINRINSAHSRV